MRRYVRTMLTVAALVGIAAVAVPAARAQSLESRSAKWHCDVVTTYSCQVQGCEPGSFDPQVIDPNAADVDIDFTTKQYVRAGWAAQQFTARVEKGITAFFLPDATVYAIVRNDGKEFVEARSNGYWTMSSFGSCRPQ